METSGCTHTTNDPFQDLSNRYLYWYLLLFHSFLLLLSISVHLQHRFPNNQSILAYPIRGYSTPSPGIFQSTPQITSMIRSAKEIIYFSLQGCRETAILLRNDDEVEVLWTLDDGEDFFLCRASILSMEDIEGGVLLAFVVIISVAHTKYSSEEQQLEFLKRRCLRVWRATSYINNNPSMAWRVCIPDTEESDDSDWIKVDHNRWEKNRWEKMSTRISDMRALVRAVRKLHDSNAELRGNVTSLDSWQEYMKEYLKRRRTMFAGDQLISLKVGLRHVLAVQHQKRLKYKGNVYEVVCKVSILLLKMGWAVTQEIACRG